MREVFRSFNEPPIEIRLNGSFHKNRALPPPNSVALERPSPSRALGVLTTPTFLEQNETTVLALPRQNRIVTDAPDMPSLLRALLSDSVRRTRPANFATAEADAVHFSFGARLSSVVWSLALREEPTDTGRWWNPRSRWRIGAWPRFDQLERSPALIRLAALFSDSALSVAQASARSALPEAQVAAFLRACEVCGISITADHSEVPRPAGLCRGLPIDGAWRVLLLGGSHADRSLFSKALGEAAETVPIPLSGGSGCGASPDRLSGAIVLLDVQAHSCASGIAYELSSHLRAWPLLAERSAIVVGITNFEAMRPDELTVCRKVVASTRPGLPIFPVDPNRSSQVALLRDALMASAEMRSP